MKAILSEKGQVTIPKAIRDRLGLRPGQVLNFEADAEGRLIATKAPVRSVVDAVYGILHFDASTDDIMRELRGDRDDLL
jgi:antitoxin PrlF